ncbi:protein mono-ADP-ribosyltransferase PARP12-like [Xenentodon cancila]
MESEILRYICASQGAVNADDLIYNLFPGDSTTEILRNQQKFVLSYSNGGQKVVARTSLRLCRIKGCLGTCRGLHLCKNLLFSGYCHYTQRGRVCSFSHELNSGHNESLLREHELESLNMAELCTLLLQSDHTFMPSICHDYNNGEGEFGRCKDGAGCKRLHICETFVSRDCSCSKNHDFNAPQPIKLLRDRGLPGTLICSLRCGHGQRGNHQQQRHNSAANGGEDLYSSDGVTEDSSQHLNSSTSDVSVAANDTDAGSDSGRSRQRERRSQPGRGRGGNRGNTQPQRAPTEICMYFIIGHCKHKDQCFQAHDKMPYRWEVLEGDRWTGLPNNEAIERDYCDPQNSYRIICIIILRVKTHKRIHLYHTDFHGSSSPAVYFDSMTCGQKKVRRLSTLSSLVKPNFILTTNWLWYWEDEYGEWNLYASDSAGHTSADLDSAELEQNFLNNDKEVLDFTAGSQSYSLSFQDMMQMNKRYGTMRAVRRRPRFVSAADVQATRARRPPTNSSPVPDNWDKTQIPEIGFSKISVKRTSAEFQTVEALFCTTMQGFDIIGIERIQNKPLWEVFQWQKNQMKNKNRGCNVTEKQLFHGTDSKHVDAICQDNFDWRICGSHGTVYGQGSYFARDATYSHNFTSDSKIRTMFLSRVLVGTYTRGFSDYRRPPPKDGGDKQFYDSCVDNVMSPSIYVVFEKHQIYPEYLIQYKTTHPLVDIVSRASVTVSVQQPTVTQKPRLKRVPAPKTAASVTNNSRFGVSKQHSIGINISISATTNIYTTTKTETGPRSNNSCFSVSKQHCIGINISISATTNIYTTTKTETGPRSNNSCFSVSKQLSIGINISISATTNIYTTTKTETGPRSNNSCFSVSKQLSIGINISISATTNIYTTTKTDTGPRSNNSCFSVSKQHSVNIGINISTTATTTNCTKTNTETGPSTKNSRFSVSKQHSVSIGIDISISGKSGDCTKIKAGTSIGITFDVSISATPNSCTQNYTKTSAGTKTSSFTV